MDAFDEASQQEVSRLMIASTKMDGAYYFYARSRGAKENLLCLLYALGDGQPHTQTQVCEDWLIPKTTVNTNVQELRRRGYLELLPGETRREKTLRLTEAGLAYADALLMPLYRAEQAAYRAACAQYSEQFAEGFRFFSDVLCRELEAAVRAAPQPPAP